MDPKECLLLASDALLSLDIDSTREHLRNYRGWRHRGGFEPVLQEHELPDVYHIPEGGIQGDLLERHILLSCALAHHEQYYLSM